VHLSGDLDHTQDVLELMLRSHDQWFTLIADGHSTEGLDTSSPQVSAAHFLLSNPNRARIELLNPDGQVTLTWILDQDQITELEHRTNVPNTYPARDFYAELSSLPWMLNEIEDTLQLHPMVSLSPSPLATYLYSGGLAQLPGTYTAAGEEEMNGRMAWLLEFTAAPLEDHPEESARYWVDQETGIILRAEHYRAGELRKEVSITNIELNTPFFDQYFLPWL
jgi:outer membrane lipoprotein-sorting protein